jgi:hypothetical protein
MPRDDELPLLGGGLLLQELIEEVEVGRLLTRRLGEHGVEALGVRLHSSTSTPSSSIPPGKASAGTSGSAFAARPCRSP